MSAHDEDSSKWPSANTDSTYIPMMCIMYQDKESIVESPIQLLYGCSNSIAVRLLQYNINIVLEQPYSNWITAD